MEKMMINLIVYRSNLRNVFCFCVVISYGPHWNFIIDISSSELRTTMVPDSWRIDCLFINGHYRWDDLPSPVSYSTRLVWIKPIWKPRCTIFVFTRKLVVAVQSTLLMRKFEWISISYDLFEVFWAFHAIKPIIWSVQASIAIQNDIFILLQFFWSLVISWWTNSFKISWNTKWLK
jgi:hypothetical protein